MKKIFISIIALQEKEKLAQAFYSTENGMKPYPVASAFPIITSMYNYVEKNDEVEVVSVIMDENSEANYITFLSEIESLKRLLGFEFSIEHKIIRTTKEETRDNNVKFFEDIIKSYDHSAKVYVDLTYGQKPKSIALYSSLLYAEKAAGCSVESVIYGVFDWATKAMSIADISFMYTMNSIIAIALENGNEDIKGIIDLLMKM